MTFEYGYLGLFLASFLAATILPVASELFLTSMFLLGYEPLACVMVATTGNTLGAWLNYGIGYLGKPEWLQKLGAQQAAIDRWQTRIHQYGSWMALLCWVPVIGDVIGIALGFFRAPWLPTFILMGVGKLFRYLLVWAGYYFW
jgi:membrane protein YqaA with SNARE-associated domain